MKRNAHKATRLIAFALCLVFWISPIYSQIEHEPFLLVESVPLETNLGLPATARTLPVWKKMITSAQKSIEIACFYFSNKQGETLDQVVKALLDAANRGVNVRILADSGMSQTYPKALSRLDQSPNIRVAKISFYNQRGAVMHAKYMIVDKEKLFLGSQNFDWRALSHIHETGIYIHDSRLAKTMLLAFDQDWQTATGQKNSGETKGKGLFSFVTAQNPIVLVNSTGDTLICYPTFSPKESVPRDLANDEDELVHLLSSAKTELCIQLLSYSPVSRGEYYPVLDQEIRKAAARGVRVKLLVSNWNVDGHRLPFLKSLAAVPNIQVKISSIPQWSGGFIPYARVEHCKFLIVDNKRGWLGTSNWGKSYFHTSRNVGLVFRGTSLISLLRQTFMKSWKSDYAERLDICREYQPPRIR